jgi:YVTN family beta-propeller protein
MEFAFSNNLGVSKACKPSLKRTIAAAFLLSGVFGSVLAGTTAYIPSQSGGSSVIDTSTQTQTTVLTGLGSNYSTSVAPNGTVAYAADYDTDAVFPINTTTNAVGTSIAVGSNPINVTFSPDSAFAYVSNFGGNSISVINVSTATVSSTVASVCPSGEPAQSVFHGVKLLIVCNGNPSSLVRSMDTSASNALTTLATVQNNAYNIAISTSSGFGYVSNNLSGSVSKFDLTSGTTTHYPTTGVSAPLGLAVTPDGNKIYLADYSGPNLIVMDPSGSILSTLNLGGFIAGLGMSSNGSVIYAPLQGSASGIKVINTSTDAVTATIATPGASTSVIWGDFLGNVSASAAPAGPAAIPTLSEWAMIFLASLMGLFAFARIRRQS